MKASLETAAGHVGISGALQDSLTGLSGNTVCGTNASVVNTRDAPIDRPEIGIGR